MQNKIEFITLDEAIEFYKNTIKTAENEEYMEQNFQLIKWLEELKFYRANFYAFEDSYLKILTKMYKEENKNDAK